MLIRFFLKKFEGRDFIEREKARVYLHYSFLMIFLLALLPVGYALQDLPTPTTIKATAGAIGIIVLVLASLVFLRMGRLNLAVGVYAVPTIIMVAVVRLLNTFGAHETAFSTYSFYMPYMIVFVGVFGKRWHVPVTTLFFLANNALVFFLFRGETGPIGNTIATGTVNSSLGMLVTAVSVYSLVTIMNAFARRLRADAEASAGKMRKLEAVMAQVRDGLDVGGTLVQEAQSMQAGLESMEGSLEASRDRIAALAGDIGEAKRSNDEIVNATAGLGRAGDSYRAITERASAAVNEMTASIQGMSTVSGRSKKSIAVLAESINQGETAASLAAETMGRISGNADSLLSMVDVITGIAGQTNLLAMNAAIEAAHAGDSGKGFAVVADEIRRLAEQTGENIKAITSGMNAFIADLAKASEANGGIVNAFTDIEARTAEAIGAFDEIIAGLQEMGQGTAEIDGAVSAVVESSGGMAASIRTVDGMVAGNNGSMDSVRLKSEESLAGLEKISEGFNELLSLAQKVRALGERSGVCMSGMDEAIRGLHSGSASGGI